MVGTNGKKALAVTARLADMWNWDFRMETFAPAYQILKQECEAIGRDVKEIKVTLGGSVHFPKDVSEFVPTDYKKLNDEPNLGPTPADAIEHLRPFVELGVSHFQIFFEDQRTIDLFGEEVAPKLVAMAQ